MVLTIILSFQEAIQSINVARGEDILTAEKEQIDEKLIKASEKQYRNNHIKNKAITN